MQDYLNKPAFENFGVRSAQWIRQPATIEAKLSRALQIGGSYSKLDTPQEGLLGHYKVTTPGSTVFIKIIRPNKARRQLAADRLAGQLQAGGFLVSATLDNNPRPIDHDHVALTYDYIAGEYLPHTEHAIAKLGHALGCLHRELGQLTCANEVRQRCTARWENLLTQKETLKHLVNESAVTASVKESVLSSIEQNITDHLRRSPQMIHGDLNYGNVLLARRSGSPVVFLDFEEAIEAHYSPLFDVAMVIERFILNASSDQDLLLSAFREAYRKAGGGWFSTDAPLAGMLKGLALRALLILTASHTLGWAKWKEKEWLKFCELHEKAVQNDLLLTRWSKCQA
ncbi:MAG: phosphotransferase [Dinoroseobacter sp.]|nr:phosphotransferase [Dinoroseobacter sp.]